MADRTDSGMPRVLAIAWGMDVAPARGPRRELSHEAIVDAAIELADAGGLAAVTMARVAESLGFTTMSLYRYVASKDELIALMQDAVARYPEVLAVDAEDWRTGLRDLVGLVRELYVAHPWVLDVPMSLQNVLMPQNLKVADAAYRAMRTLPVDQSVKQAVLLALTMLARVYGQLERDLARAGPDLEISPEGIAMLMEVVTPRRFPDLAPVLATGGYTGDPPGEGDAGDDLELALRLLLDGLAAHVAARPRVTTPSPAPPAPATGAATDPATDPATVLARAERDLESVTAQRKVAQARVKELERREREAQRARDRARKGLGG